MMFNRYFRYWIFLGLFIFVTSSAQSLEAATLHAIIVADTSDDSIGDSVEIDKNNMNYELEVIKKNTGMDLKKSVVQGKNVHTKTVLNLVKNLKVEDDDVIFFYYSGHGFREYSKEGRWPNLYFSLDDQGIDFTYIRELLEKQNPRLLLLFADVCNSKVSFPIPLARCKGFSFAKPHSYTKENYERLFLDTRGVVMATSSSVGEYSLCTAYQGGYFTSVLLNNLSQETDSNPTLSWDELMSSSQSQVYQTVINLGYSQYPDFDLELK